MVASWFSQPFWSLPLPLPLPLCPPLSLPLFLPFFPPLGAKSLPFWSATVKKGVSCPGWNHPLWSLWLGLCPCPWRPEKRGYLSQVPDQSRHILYDKGGRWGGRGCCDRGGWVSRWGARMHANRTWAVWRRSTTTAGICENHVRELRTFFTVVLEPNIHTFSVLSETLPDFLKSKLC